MGNKLVKVCAGLDGFAEVSCHVIKQSIYALLICFLLIFGMVHLQNSTSRPPLSHPNSVLTISYPP